MSDMRFSSGSDRPQVLPGEDLIEAGLRDLHDGSETIEALLVAIGAPRLRHAGIDVPETRWDIPNTASTNCWPRMTLIPRIRVTMP